VLVIVIIPVFDAALGGRMIALPTSSGLGATLKAAAILPARDIDPHYAAAIGSRAACLRFMVSPCRWPPPGISAACANCSC